jgi:hypothetical protein
LLLDLRLHLMKLWRGRRQAWAYNRITLAEESVMAFRTVFALILLGVLDTAGASPIVIDSNGRFVGFYLGQDVQQLRDVESAVSSTGYRFEFKRASGLVVTFEDNYVQGYTTVDCSGQVWMQGGATPGFVFPLFNNVVGNSAPLFFLDQAPPSTQLLTILSRRSSSGQCEPTNSAGDFWPVLPNDPNVTGVPGSTLPAPLRVISSWLFRDGFEQPLSGTSPTGVEWSTTA